MMVPLAGRAQKTGSTDQPPPMNVLFIAVDDLRNDLGCYGEEQIKSPNIDRLADSGVMFDRAYCQYPLCNPSRASVMTGRRPNATGVNIQEEQNWKDFREALPDAVTLPQLFMDNGYFAARVGKIFHYGVPREIGLRSLLDDDESWDLALFPRGSEKDEEGDLISYTPDRNPGWALSWAASPSGPLEHTDGQVATEAIQLMNLVKGQPFFLAVGFYRPHVPCTAPAEFFDLYPLESIQMPDEPPEHFDHIPAAAFIPKMQVPNQKPEEMRLFRRAYYASISYVDSQIGRVIDAVTALGLADNTVIVLWGDHGWMLGEHRQWTKPTLFEEAARAPLIIHAPGMAGNGTASPRLVEFVDMYRTIADLCGLEPPAEVEGTSLRPLLENPTATWERPAYTQLGRRGVDGRSVRTDRWRYTEWNGGSDGIELYDQADDPREYHNLADDPALAAERARLRELLHRGRP